MKGDRGLLPVHLRGERRAQGASGTRRDEPNWSEGFHEGG